MRIKDLAITINARGESIFPPSPHVHERVWRDLAATLGPLAPYTMPAHVAELAATELWQYRCLALKADLATLAAYESEVASLEGAPIREVARLRATWVTRAGQPMAHPQPAGGAITHQLGKGEVS